MNEAEVNVFLQLPCFLHDPIIWPLCLFETQLVRLVVPGAHTAVRLVVPGAHTAVRLVVPGARTTVRLVVPGAHTAVRLVVPGAHTAEAWLAGLRA